MLTQDWQVPYDRDLPPEPVPDMVRCCGECGEEIGGWQISDDEILDRCTGCGTVEGKVVEVPWQVYEQGADEALAYAAARCEAR